MKIMSTICAIITLIAGLYFIILSLILNTKNMGSAFNI